MNENQMQVLGACLTKLANINVNSWNVYRYLSPDNIDTGQTEYRRDVCSLLTPEMQLAGKQIRRFHTTALAVQYCTPSNGAIGGTELPKKNKLMAVN